MTEQRIPLDDLTSSALDGLYARLAKAERAVRRAEGSESWMAKHLARQDSRVHGLTKELGKQRRRAEQAEATVERVKNLRTIAPDGAQGPPWAALDLAIRDAIDQPQQPTTTEQEPTASAPSCSARVPNPEGSAPLRTCDLPNGHAGWHHDAQHQDHWVHNSPNSWQSSTTTA